MAPILIVLVTLSVFTTFVAAPATDSIDKAFVLGTVNFIDTPDGAVRAWGLILVTATEPDKAMVRMFFFVPAYREMWYIQLVNPTKVEISESSICCIEGYWDVYVNCKLFIDSTRATFATYDVWGDWVLDFGACAPVFIAGSVICHRYQPGILD